MVQDFMQLSDVKKMMMSLAENCRLLSRFSLVCPAMAWKMGTQELSNHFSTFCDNLPNLVALFGVLKVSEMGCQELINTLRNRYREKRPAFCVDIQPMIPEYDSRTLYDSEELPLTHSDILLRIESTVANFPYNRESILDRLK